MDADDLKKRTKLFALRILKLAAALPRTIEGNVIRGQLVKRERLLVLTTGPHVAAVQEESLPSRSVLLKKKLTRVRFGSN
ncbi:MAG TPA: hypothetical protein VKB46_11355 [Pyrinomonadaceae bacterium]|nr:hypothetical protein [Pyrinomonadaceae bacterium]